MNRVIKYMNGSVFSKARYMNGVSFEILARTPVPKLPPPPPPPPTKKKNKKIKNTNSNLTEYILNSYVSHCFKVTTGTTCNNRNSWMTREIIKVVFD